MVRSLEAAAGWAAPTGSGRAGVGSAGFGEAAAGGLAESAESALDLLQEKDTPRLLVADGGDLVGSLTLEHVAAAMRRRGA